MTPSFPFFSIHKSGYDDKQAYEYMQVEGELAIDYDLTYEDYNQHTSENWKISGASPTYLRDNMKGALSVHASGTLHGTLNTYSNSKSSGYVVLSTDLLFSNPRTIPNIFLKDNTFSKILKTTNHIGSIFRVQ